MKSKRLIGLLLVISLLAICGTLMAHHASAAYADKPLEFKNAKNTKFSWMNPHTLIYFDTKDAKGNVVNWTCETAAPQALRLIGWTKESITPGDNVTVTMYAAKNGNPAGRLNKIVLADGTVLHDTQLGGDEGNKSGYGHDAGSRNR